MGGVIHYSSTGQRPAAGSGDAMTRSENTKVQSSMKFLGLPSIVQYILSSLKIITYRMANDCTKQKTGTETRRGYGKAHSSGTPPQLGLPLRPAFVSSEITIAIPPPATAPLVRATNAIPAMFGLNSPFRNSFKEVKYLKVP